MKAHDYSASGNYFVTLCTLKRSLRTACALTMLAVFSCPGGAAELGGAKLGSWSGCLSLPGDWYSSAEAVRIAENVVAFQRPCGGWSKRTGFLLGTYTPEELERALKPERTRARIHDGVGCKEHSHSSSTFDNNATTTEIRYLARVFAATGDGRFREACLRGIDYVLEAQYDNGGWPQNYPNTAQYGGHITFNDDAMIGVMRVLEKVAIGDPRFDFIDADRRERARAAFEKGIDCIVKCQIEVGGRLTGWCQQHDATTLEPRQGRIYELPSISGFESISIVRFLIGLEEPSPEVIAAVEGAVAWFKEVKLVRIRLEDRADPALDRPFAVRIRENPEKPPFDYTFQGRGFDRVVIKDAAADPIWARFYEIGSNRPIFADAEGIARYRLADISYERRVRYSWYSDLPARVLSTYPNWKKRVEESASVEARPR